MKNKNYSVLKLRTGETLFAELIAADETSMSIIKPWIVRDETDETLSLAEWIPYVENEVYTIPHNICYFVGKMNKKFIKFYGSVILQSALNKIKEDVYNTMNDRNDYSAMANGLQKMKDITQQISSEFELEDEAVDFSSFEEHLDKHKPVMH